MRTASFGSGTPQHEVEGQEEVKNGENAGSIFDPEAQKLDPLTTAEVSQNELTHPNAKPTSASINDEAHQSALEDEIVEN